MFLTLNIPRLLRKYGQPFRANVLGRRVSFCLRLGKARSAKKVRNVFHAPLCRAQSRDVRRNYIRMSLTAVHRVLTRILPRNAQVNLLCQAASLLVAVKTQQFKREIAAKKEGGKSKAKRGLKDKKASKQA